MDEAWVDARLAERILAQAPQADDGYFVVPDIPHEALE
jgi:Asp-tRNA(Asn)/Glu-tRNA(Gln) amidotransferase C subunit